MKAATKFKVFCIRYFSKTKRKPAKKKSKQCISSKTKSTCQNSTTSEHFQKWPKNQGVVLALSLSIILLLFQVNGSISSAEIKKDGIKSEKYVLC